MRFQNDVQIKLHIITQCIWISVKVAVLIVVAVAQIFEVTSTTTIKDLCYSIASQLRLSSADGYGLYLKTPNKVGFCNIPAKVCLLIYIVM